jgi:hypothetical protein
MTIIDTGTPKPDPGVYPKGRRCQHDRNGVRCVTVLHTNNPGPFCELHTVQPDPPKVMKARLEMLAMEEAA